MRIAALILGILGALASGFLGSRWLSDYNENKELLAAAAKMGADTGDLDKVVMGAYILLVAAAVSLVGGIMTLKGKGKIFGPLMILLALSPVAFKPEALIFTSLTLIGGILAFLAKPAQPAA